MLNIKQHNRENNMKTKVEKIIADAEETIEKAEEILNDDVLIEMLKHKNTSNVVLDDNVFIEMFKKIK